MYNVRNPYMQDGGQPQINKEQAVVQQLIQAFMQLSPQGQQMFVQGLQQVMQQSQGQGDPAQQQAPPDQGQGDPSQQQQPQQPQQRMGGYNNPGFRNLPQSVQDKIRGNS